MNLSKAYSSKGDLAAIAILLLISFALRLHEITQFPIFIDEPGHMEFSREALAGRPFVGASHSKLFAGLWTALFLPVDVSMGSLFTARAATTFFSLIALALVYRLAVNLAGRRAGLIAALLYLSAPYLIFYDRLVLIDTYMMTFGLLAIWAALRVRHTLSLRDALLCGLAMAGALAAKGTGIIVAAVPMLAALLLIVPQRWRTQQRSVIRWVAAAYGVFAAIWIPLYLLLRWRRIDYFGLVGTLSNTGAGTETAATNFLTRLIANIGDMWQVDAIYFSMIGLLVLLALALYWLPRQWRPAAYLWLALLIPTAAILVLSPNVRPRYIVYHVPLLIVAAAVGAEQLRGWLQARVGSGIVRAALTLLLVLWLALVSAPFYLTLQNNPAELLLPPADRGEYVSNDSAGFSLPQIAASLEAVAAGEASAATTGAPLTVIGLLANCHSLEFYMARSTRLVLDCPLITWDGSRQVELAGEVNQLAASGRTLYLIVENLPYISAEGIKAASVEMGIFTRPGGYSKLTVYRIN